MNAGETKYRFREATAADIEDAALKADKAFRKYRTYSGERKAFFLETIAEQIDSAKDDLVETAMKETHLTKARLEGEVGRTVNQLKLFASLLREGSWVRAIIDTAIPERKPLPKPDIRQMQVPLGPVAVFGASNFPFAFSVAGGDTASAFAAGCPVVCKAHPGHPETSDKVALLIYASAAICSIPNGVFSLVHAANNETSIQLVTNPYIKAVGFTGSLGGGRSIFDAAVRRPEPIPVYAEMGSVNPVFILPEIVKEQAAVLAEKLAMSNLLSTGQFCTNPGLIISLESEATDQFLGYFATHVRNSAAELMLTESICNGFKSGINSIQQNDKLEWISSGKEAAGDYVSAYMFKIPGKDFLADKNLMHEVFGPSSIHVIAEDETEMKNIAEALQGQLTCSIWGTEQDLVANTSLVRLLELKGGRIIFNNLPTGVEVTHAMVHGGPYPATTDSRTTSVGTAAIYRFTRAVCYQNCPQSLLPAELKNENPLQLWRMVNGNYSSEDVE